MLQHLELPPTARALIIGDVHGCYDELAALVAEVDDPGRSVIFVGDLVAKGPAPEQVVAWLRRSGSHSVLGNHDHRYLRFKQERDKTGKWPAGGETERLQRLAPEDWDTLAALPLSLRVSIASDAHATLVVHGGLVPGVAPEDQDPSVLMNLRSFDDQGAPSSKLDGTPWIDRWAGPERVVFGHDAVRGLQRAPQAFGLDTGCVYGGELTGLLLPEERLLSVPAARCYKVPQGEP